MKTIYLDYCSTTPASTKVIETMRDYLSRGFANPSSQHRPGQTARKELERLRNSILKMLGGRHSGMHQDRLILTSGGTESNHLAISGLVPDDRRTLLVSAVEHPGLTGASEIARGSGISVRTIPVDSNGVVLLDVLENLLGTAAVGLVSVMTVNNETGVVQPIRKIADLCHEYGALVHTDAVQAVAYRDLSFTDLGVDAMTVAAHKFYGPRGIGGLLIRTGLEIRPMWRGGSQQLGSRPGTEDVALAAAMECALSETVSARPGEVLRITEMRKHFEELLRRSSSIPVVIHGEQVERSPHVSNLGFADCNRQELLLAADFAGLAISAGSACASGSSEPSPVLLAMGLETGLVEGAVRVSFGRATTGDDIDRACEILVRAALRQKQC